MKCSLTKVQTFIGSKDLDGLMPVVLTVSLFFPFYISVLTVSGAAVMMMLSYNKRTKAFEPPYTNFLLGSMIGSFFVAAVYNNYWGMLYSILLLAVVICGLYLRSIMTRQLFNQMMDLACAASVFSALIAFYQKISMYATAPQYRPVSTFTNANYYGTMIEFVVLIAFYRMFTNSKDKGFYLAIVGINLAGLYLSASMSSCFALVCGLFVMLFLKKRYSLMGVLLLIVVAFAITSFVFPAIFPRVEAIDHTLGQRISIWQTAFKGIQQHLFFGQGATAYRMICGEFNGYVTFHCHNLLLDTLLNFGFVGSAAISAYIFAQIKLLILRFRHGLCMNMNILVAAMFVAVLVHGFTDVTIFWVQTGALFTLVFSSTGISAAYLERKLHVPGAQLLNGYASVGMHTAYLKNS